MHAEMLRGEAFIKSFIICIDILSERGENFILVLTTEYHNRWNYFQRNKRKLPQDIIKKLDEELLDLENEIAAEVQ